MFYLRLDGISQFTQSSQDYQLLKSIAAPFRFQSSNSLQDSLDGLAPVAIVGQDRQDVVAGERAVQRDSSSIDRMSRIW